MQRARVWGVAPHPLTDHSRTTPLFKPGAGSGTIRAALAHHPAPAPAPSDSEGEPAGGGLGRGGARRKEGVRPQDEGLRLYDELAWLWPIVSPPEDYREECAEYRQRIEQRSRRLVRSLLHLGCGGGHHDYHLQRHFTVTGVDRSPAMLALARRLNPGVTYCVGDLREVRLGEAFDAVVLFDAVAYMLSPCDLQAAFETAFAQLRPGGVFLTVVEATRERFRQNRTWTSVHTSADTEVVLVENVYDPDRSDTTYEVTFLYLIRRNGSLAIEADRHRCGIFALGTWLDLLTAVGFAEVQHEAQPSGTVGEGDDAGIVLTALRP